MLFQPKLFGLDVPDLKVESFQLSWVVATGPSGRPCLVSAAGSERCMPADWRRTLQLPRHIDLVAHDPADVAEWVHDRLP